MKKLILTLMLVMPTVLFAQTTPPIEPGVSQELARWRAARYSDVRYKLNLTLEKMSPVLKGTMEIRVNHAVTAESEPTPKFIVLDWREIKGFEDKSTVSNVSINGKAAVLAASLTTPPAQSGGHPSLDKEGRGTSSVTYAEEKEHLVFSGGVVVGENVIKLDFTSPILASGSAITRYVDKEDGAEYIYSLFVPSDASTAFPVFDQPDLKARFSLNVSAPQDWRVISNGEELQTSISSAPDWKLPLHQPTYDLSLGISKPTAKPSNTPTVTAQLYSRYFNETKPISTYVFAFAAGPWEKVEDTGGNASVNERASGAGAVGTLPNGRVSARSSIYVRKSQAAKFKPHAAEVFRLNREAVRYFEQYFDYKFPFPKYDLVLIPEFPFGGMEHAGATFLRESSIIFPQEPTKNDLVSRATLIFHEAAHQWFGDTVTMRWFDDLWLKEGFATFTAYKAMEKIMPEMNAWKVFYERIKQGAYQTDSTRGTTAIYQPIANLSAAKSAYGNIVYNKAPAFLRQAEFYLGEDKFQTAVRAFLKKHEFGNAGWEDLVGEFETVMGKNSDVRVFSSIWVNKRGLPKFTYAHKSAGTYAGPDNTTFLEQTNALGEANSWITVFNVLTLAKDEKSGDYIRQISTIGSSRERATRGLVIWDDSDRKKGVKDPDIVFPNYGDYGYGIFLLDDKSRDYVLKNIQSEKDPFLRTMMWGALWDSVREGELDPRVFVELVVKNLAKARTTVRAISSTDAPELDESTVQLLLSRVSVAMSYYIPAPDIALTNVRASAPEDALRSRVEDLLIERMQNASSLGQRITYYRAFLNIAASEKARGVLKGLLKAGTTGGNASVNERASSPAPDARSLTVASLPVRTKDKFDIVTRLLILNDPDAPKLLADLEKAETSDEAKRYAYAAKAGIATAENKAMYWKDFTENKEISESWIEAAFGPWNSIRHSELTLPYLERALKELPNHKRSRKIFFVNGWLGAFIGGQRSPEALAVVNKFLADNPGLDNDLRLKILENVDLIERAVNIRRKSPQV